MTLWRALSLVPERRGIYLLAGLIMAVLTGNMIGQVAINKWTGNFYDAIEARNLVAFWRELGVFIVIVTIMLLLVVAQTWMQELFKIRLRYWLTDDLLDTWLTHQRAYRMAFAGEIGLNPDQRIQADVRQLAELSSDLGVGLLQATGLLVTFVGVLWILSEQVVFVMHGERFTIPGYVVWCALAYAIAGSWLTWRVGRPLVPQNAERYAREAAFRAAVVRVDTNAESIALFGSEAQERVRLEKPLNSVLLATRKIADGIARVTWVTSGYGWLAIVVPIIVVAPGYFGGEMTFGDLMMVVAAFNQVLAALRWFVDNFIRIADWRAVLQRIAAFREAARELDTLGASAAKIDRRLDTDGGVVIENLAVMIGDGTVRPEDPTITVQKGGSLLILGDTRSGKTTLFRAVAGLWPWGKGHISLPPAERTMFLPQRAYMPSGTLRALFAYPDPEGTYPDEAIAAAMNRVGLGHLVDNLGRQGRFDQEASLSEQQRVGFVRVLLRKPDCVILDDAVSALEPQDQERMLSIFEFDLPGTTVVSIGRRAGRKDYFQQVVALHRTPIKHANSANSDQLPPLADDHGGHGPSGPPDELLPDDLSDPPAPKSPATTS
ncbi:MAG: ABC transporter ATP-binding protein/permease [Geminicoccaceae bacterium]